MNNSLIIFYIHSLLIILSATLVIVSINPIHSVLFLVLVFLNSSALLILIEAEFLAITLIIVYVGAIAVLFLFVVMMLNIKVIVSNITILRYLPIGGIIGIIFLLQVLLIYNKATILNENINLEYIQQIYHYNQVINWDNNLMTNIQIIGQYLYVYYYDLFLISGLVLLVAMIGAIVLTMHINYNIKKQQVFLQLYNK
uniref:NADH-ubiquinone oxidoreductase chain 6 n=1 Tax=Malawimonas californiana TaxID=221722 RepID=A0A0B5GFT1_MALCL|nr:NADH dehydrogenase subunit 6 [Malawimonas californiana]AJF22867.1 NADH dehydrogenase subunit 6 [Malawimonas californiana]